jgi:hypothetical protein
MTKKKTKEKLNRRGKTLYNTYFYNPDVVIDKIIELYDNGKTIDPKICDYIFDVPADRMPHIYELIMYYPNLLKRVKYVNGKILGELYLIYGETINIMNDNKTTNNKTVRSRLHNGAYKRTVNNNIPFTITGEDILLPTYCSLLGVKLEYANNVASDFSPSIDRIDPNLGYVKNNIQIISFLGNRMKNSATPDMLIKFAKTILERYDV